MAHPIPLGVTAGFARVCARAPPWVLRVGLSRVCFGCVFYMPESSSSPSVKRSLGWSANTLHKGCKLLANFSVEQQHLLRDSKTSLTDVGTCFTIIVTSLLSADMLDSSQRLLIHIAIPVWYRSHGNRSKTALRACSWSGFEEKHVCISYFYCHLMILGPWDPAAVEPSTCSSEGQDLAEPDTLDADAAYVSTSHKLFLKAWSQKYQAFRGM